MAGGAAAEPNKDLGVTPLAVVGGVSVGLEKIDEAALEVVSGMGASPPLLVAGLPPNTLGLFLATVANNPAPEVDRFPDPKTKR